jgi:hypothetical protein
MQHSMAIRAYEGEISELGCLRSCKPTYGNRVMCLYEAVTQITIDVLEIESAHVAGQAPRLAQARLLEAGRERAISFEVAVQAKGFSALRERRLIVFRRDKALCDMDRRCRRIDQWARVW